MIVCLRLKVARLLRDPGFSGNLTNFVYDRFRFLQLILELLLQYIALVPDCLQSGSRVPVETLKIGRPMKRIRDYRMYYIEGIRVCIRDLRDQRSARFMWIFLFEAESHNLIQQVVVLVRDVLELVQCGCREVLQSRWRQPCIEFDESARRSDRIPEVQLRAELLLS